MVSEPRGRNDKDAYPLYAYKPQHHSTNNVTKKKNTNIV